MTSAEFQREIDWHVENLESYIDGVSREDGGEGDLLDYFCDAAGIGYREDANGEYESAFVYLTWGNPTIELDTATGEIYGHRWNFHGSAFLSDCGKKAVNEFLKEIHDC